MNHTPVDDSDDDGFELNNHDQDLPNDSFNRYQMERKLGSGGMATVMLAYDTHLKRRVALKVPRISPTQNIETFERRFLREARTAMTVSHPNLCELYDVGVDRETFFFTMEFIDGMTLIQLLEQTGPLAELDAAVLFAKVCSALEALHRANILHRDLKPENIMIDYDGRPVVLDFGLPIPLRQTRDAKPLTATDEMVGTPSYMSPEQVLGQSLTERSEIFSLGLVLWTMLCNEPLYEGHPKKVMDALLSETKRSPKEIRTDLSGEMEAICMKCIARHPEDRFQSMVELEAAFIAFSKT